MRESGGQERRAFLAIVLAMGVLLVWNVLFPPPQRPPASAPEQAAQETATAPEANAPAPGATATSPGQTAPLATQGVTAPPQGALDPLPGAPPADPVAVHVESERIHLTIDALGARLTEVALPNYRETGDREVQLLPQPGAGALATVVATAGGRLPVH